MTTTSKYCLICYNKASCEIGSSKSEIGNAADGAQATLKLFFKLLERLLNENTNFAGGGVVDRDRETTQFLFDQVIDAGMLACGNCFKLVESFCELYQEVKSLELRLNWKVGLLKDIMFSAERDHPRMKMFMEGAKLIKFEDFRADEIIDLIIDFKGDLVKKCTRKLNRSFPRLTLDKIKCSSTDVKKPPMKATTATLSTKFVHESNVLNTTKKRETGPIIGRKSQADPGPDVEPSDIKTENEGFETDSGTIHYDDNLEHVGPNDSLPAKDVIITAQEEGGQNQEKSKEEESISCDLCGVEVRTHRGLQAHRAARHPDAEIKMTSDQPTKKDPVPDPHIMCKLCGKKFSTQGGYFTHHQSIHVGLRFKCEKCGQLFSQRSGLNSHQRTTVGCGGNAPKYICSVCDKAFTKSCALNRHKKSVHLKAKDYLCSECGKGFPYLNELKRHQTVHSDLRRHLCDLCGKGFKFQGQLTAHKKTHMGIELVGAGEPDAHEPDAVESEDYEPDAGESEAHEPDAGESEAHEPDAGESEDYEPDPGVSEAHEPDAHQPHPIDSSSKLRSLHRCGRCSKTFSTPVKLAEHEKSHINSEDGDDPDPDIEDSDDDDDDDDANEDLEGSESDYDCNDGDATTRTEKSEPEVKGDNELAPRATLINKHKEGVKKTQARRRRRSPPESIKSIMNPQTGKHGCTHCSQEFDLRLDYLAHFRSAHAGNGSSLQCHKCSKTFKFKTSLWEHLRLTNSCGTPNAHPKSKCTICGKEFSRPFDLKSHIKTVHHKIRKTRRNHPCNQCGKRFQCPSKLKQHVDGVHNGLPKYWCRQCGEKFFSRLELKSHRLESHEQESPDPEENRGPVSCRICRKTFISRFKFTRHYRNVHLRLHSSHKFTKCHLCGKEFNSTNGYQSHHNIVHLGIKPKPKKRVKRKPFKPPQPAKCDKCNQSFVSKGNLRIHQKCTIGCGGNAPKHLCPTCGKGFIRTAKLKIHIKSVHEKAKDHLCSECGKGFPTAFELKRHQAVHSDLKGHLCDLCGKGFKWSTQLVSHRAKEHKIASNEVGGEGSSGAVV